MEILLYTSFGLLFILYIVLYNKHKNFKKKILNELSDLIKPIRKGYIKSSVTYTDRTPDILTKVVTEVTTKIDYILYLTEIEIYTTGESKCEYLDLEVFCKLPNHLNKIDLINHIKGKFVSLKQTDSITWLEIVGDLNVERLGKLQRLKNIINKQKTN